MFSIQDIINSLNQIEVKGRENLDRLLGCILALEAVLEAQTTTEEITPGEEAVTDNG